MPVDTFRDAVGVEPRVKSVTIGLRMGRGRFIDEEVEVRAGDFGRPRGFVWRGESFEVVEVLRAWRKLDLKRAWWRRRHRDHYLVRVSGGRVFELYFHRGPGRRYWVLLRELDPDAP